MKQPTMKTIREVCEFHYIEAATAEILHAIAEGHDTWVLVVGNPGNASYEWVVIGEAKIPLFGNGTNLCQSDCGYGSIATALRDGLTCAIDGGPSGPPMVDETGKIVTAESI